MIRILIVTWLIIILLCVGLAAIGLVGGGGFVPVGGEAILGR